MEKNTPYTVHEKGHPLDGKTLWSGRYCAVCAIVIVQKDNKNYALIGKRGSGAEKEQHKWGITCGYLDLEKGSECCSREVLEETNYIISPEEFRLFGVNTNPSDPNVTIRYIARLTDFPKKSKKDNSVEEDEIESVKWIELKDYDKYDWAFNHKSLMKKLYNFFSKTPKSVFDEGKSFK